MVVFSEMADIESLFGIYGQIVSDTDKWVNSMLDTVSCFIKKKGDLIKMLPFHLNVIDELHINENAHSRLLAKLLNYRREGKWVVLESLLKYVASVSNLESFNEIKIIKPVITQEKERIDIWIRDQEYAIIIENKVYNASDQEAQLSRYIEKTYRNGKGYPLKQIYVLYMPQTPSEPEKQSWGEYEENFKDRFAIISFKDEIRKWLKEEISPLVYSSNEKILKSAIYQYIDYLDGMFNMRESFKSYYMNIEKIISDKIGLENCNNDQERINLLQNTIDDFNSLVRDMVNLQNNLRTRVIQECKEDFKSKYPNIKSVEKVHVGYYFSFHDERYKLLISEGYSKLYCQLEKCDLSEGWTSDSDALMCNDRIKQLLPSHTHVIWKYIDSYYDIKEAYDLFLKVTHELISLGISFEEQ